MDPCPHMGRGFEAAGWQRSLGWSGYGLGVAEVGQLCFCQLFKTRMLTSFQNKTKHNSSTLWMGYNKMVLLKKNQTALLLHTKAQFFVPLWSGGPEVQG